MAVMRAYTKSLARLQAIGVRPTRQRLALDKLLFEGENRHVTAEQLHAEALEAGIRVSLATVYNTLHQFTSAGLLREVLVDPARTYFDTNTGAHHPFFSAETGELTDIPGDALTISDLPDAPRGTEVERVDVVVRVRSVDGKGRRYC